MRNELRATALFASWLATNGPRPLEVFSAAISAEMSTTALMPMRPHRSAAQMTTVIMMYAVGPTTPSRLVSTTSDVAIATVRSAIHSGQRARPCATRCTQARTNGATTMMPAVLTTIRSSPVRDGPPGPVVHEIGREHERRRDDPGGQGGPRPDERVGEPLAAQVEEPRHGKGGEAGAGSGRPEQERRSRPASPGRAPRRSHRRQRPLRATGPRAAPRRTRCPGRRGRAARRRARSRPAPRCGRRRSSPPPPRASAAPGARLGS